jgi:Glycosyltransferase family 87
MTTWLRQALDGARGMPAAAVVVAAILVFVGCCLLGPGGLLTSWHAADVSYYGQLGAHLRAGEAPYRTLYVEYPPGALPVFLAPSVDQASYVELFKVLMTVFGCAAIVATAVTARAVEASVGRLAVAVAPLAVAPVLLGSVLLNRYDVWPMLLAAVGLALVVRGRPASGGVGLALSVVTKIYAAAALPVVAVYLARTAGRAALRRATVAFAVVVALVMAPFALLGPGGLAFSFYVQLTRHLEIESLAGSALLAADRLGLYDARIVDGTPGSRDLAGSLPTAIGIASGVVEVAAIAAAAWWFAKGSPGRGRFLAAFAAAIAGYVAFGKVLSPQYLVWLLPVVPLVRGRVGLAATALLVAALALTNLEFSAWNSINRVGPAVWVLVARNLVLVAVYLLLGWSLRRGARPDGDGVAFDACANAGA